jgi:hypothetical protein
MPIARDVEGRSGHGATAGEVRLDNIDQRRQECDDAVRRSLGLGLGGKKTTRIKRWDPATLIESIEEVVPDLVGLEWRSPA